MPNEALFQPQSDAQIQMLVKGMKLAEHDARKAVQARAWDYYMGAGIQHTIKKMQRRFVDWKKYSIVPADLVATMTDERAVLYKDEPARSLVNEKGDPLPDNIQAIASEMWEQAQMNVVMSQVESLTLLQRTILVHPCWRMAADDPSDPGRIEIDVIGAHMADVIQAQGDPTRAVGVLYSTSYPDTVYEPDGGLANEQVIGAGERSGGPVNPDALGVTYWTKDRAMEFTGDGKRIVDPNNPSGENPYGTLTFITYRDSLAMDRFWLEPKHALVEANETLNLALTDLFHGMHLQLWGVPVAIGPGVPKILVFGPDKALTIETKDGQAASFTFEKPNTNIVECLDTIERTLQWVARLNHQSPSDYELRGTAASGFALTVRNMPKVEDRKKRLPLFMRNEMDLFAKMRAVWNYHNAGKQIPLDAKLSIKYEEPNVPQDPMVSEEVLQKKLDMGRVNILDVIRQENPDLKDDAAAEKWMMANLQRRDRIKKQFGFSFGLNDPNQPKPGAPPIAGDKQPPDKAVPDQSQGAGQ